MKTNALRNTLLLGSAATLLGLSACAATVKPDGASELRQQLIALQSDPNLGSRATIAMKDAQAAVDAADRPIEDAAVGAQLVYIAQRRLEIARAAAETSYAESQVKVLSEQRASARLQSRTAEAESATMAAKRAMDEAKAAGAQAMAQQKAAEMARQEALAAQQAAANSRADADASRADADAAKAAAAAAMAEAEAIKAQMAELEAKQTARGYVVTLGDVLFATGKAELASGATARLAKLGAFMTSHPEQKLVIEGHTDSVGTDANNQALSQRRAEAVRSFLMAAGIDGSRITAEGKGEALPVASNENAAGRQQNRRVEVIIAK